jgi:DNA (cytosine-5)-methyltransferase 1
MTCVDLFAGAGGFSTGAKMAGAKVVWAANHWMAAVETHQANHPETAHACQDLHQCDWTRVPKHDVLLASPACQGHSKARGKDRPHHDAARATAWAVVSCAEVHRPAFVVVENVPDFRRWILLPAWDIAMRGLGYQLTYQIIDAADLGVPQHRQRLFIVGTRSSFPLELQIQKKPYVPAESLVRDLMGARWSRVDDKCSRTRERVSAGRKQHGDRFLIAYYGNERGGRSLTRPLGTVTTRDRYAVVDGDRMRMLTVDEYRAAMSFPEEYKLPSNRRIATHLLGNAVCPPVAEAVIRCLQ